MRNQTWIIDRTVRFIFVDNISHSTLRILFCWIYSFFSLAISWKKRSYTLIGRKFRISNFRYMFIPSLTLQSRFYHIFKCDWFITFRLQFDLIIWFGFWNIIPWNLTKNLHMLSNRWYLPVSLNFLEFLNLFLYEFLIVFKLHLIKVNWFFLTTLHPLGL